MNASRVGCENECGVTISITFFMPSELGASGKIFQYRRAYAFCIAQINLLL